jgi:hypothetical protein
MPTRAIRMHTTIGDRDGGERTLPIAGDQALGRSLAHAADCGPTTPGVRPDIAAAGRSHRDTISHHVACLERAPERETSCVNGRVR